MGSSVSVGDGRGNYDEVNSDENARRPEHRLTILDNGSESNSNVYSIYITRIWNWIKRDWIIIISILQILCFISDNQGIGREYFSFDPCKKEEFWRFLTYMFVHSDWLHLAGNVFLQLVFGFILTIDTESWKVLVVYFTSGIVGTLCSSVIQPNAKIEGSSGGICGLMALSVVPKIWNWISKGKSSTLNKSILIVSVLCITILGAYDLYELSNNLPDFEIASAAHLTGMITGLLFGMISLFSPIAMYTCGISYIVIIVGVFIVLNIILKPPYICRFINNNRKIYYVNKS